MISNRIDLRVAGPTLLVSLCLFLLCGVAAIFLYRQQVTVVDELAEVVGSRKAAHELDGTLRYVLVLLRERNDQIEEVHYRTADRLSECRQHADSKTEIALVEQLEASWAQYLQIWGSQHGASGKDKEAAVLEAQEVLGKETLPLCRQLREYNTEQIELSEASQRSLFKWLAGGLIAVGVIGSISGILLGYSVTRRLRKSIYQLSVTIQDAANQLGRPSATVALIKDGDIEHVHERMKEVRREIEQVVQKLQQREREVVRSEQLAAVGQLAAGIAHELRNPLTAIKMLVQANREDRAAQSLPTEELFLIEQEIRRMERCLQHFLDFARPPQLQRRPLDLGAVVERTFALLAGRARKQHVKLVFTPPTPTVVVEADGELLQQLLVNLCINALDAMPHGGEIQVVITSSQPGQVELEVRDTGPGIAPDQIAHLFEPFVSSKETGLGLGLVISRRIAENHGGSLNGANLTQAGACFTLTLPVEGVSLN